MKSLLKLFFVVLALTAFISSCKKQENQVYFEGGTAPVLSASSLNNIIMTRPNAANTAIVFDWNNPDYRFNTGVSSQDVSYTIQIDTTGSNFTNPNLQEATVTNDLRKALTIKNLNDYLTKLGLLSDIPYNVEFRLKATLANGTVPLYSNVIKVRVTTYFDVVYPVPQKLFITGAATPLDWQCACPNDGTGAAQQFTKIGLTKFELVINLNAGKSYLFIPVYSNWDVKYGSTKSANNLNDVNGDEFQPNGKDLLSPATSRRYKITVDFATGRFTVTPQ